MNPAVLEPLAARYATWLNLPASATADTTDENWSEVRAMPVILRIERVDPPTRTALLEAAAAAALAVCLDPRTLPEGEWHHAVSSWLDSRIRKVARRARGAHWQAVQDLPGITITVNDAQARALVPTRVVEAPKEVTRLQISGSELEPDTPAPAPPDIPVLWLNPTIDMTAGKAAAQVGHATMLLAALLHANNQDDALADWSTVDYRCAVRTPTLDRWTALHPRPAPPTPRPKHPVVARRPPRFTEVDPGTVTVLAQFPSRRTDSTG